MRISDWSSDVCSSDLKQQAALRGNRFVRTGWILAHLVFLLLRRAALSGAYRIRFRSPRSCTGTCWPEPGMKGKGIVAALFSASASDSSVVGRTGGLAAG